MNQPIDHQDLHLHFVNASEVFLHEETDPLRIERLRKSVEFDGFLRNPPIVAKTPDGNYTVLDGATRTTMLKNKGLDHLLVQVVDYTEQVQLHGWYHVLPDEAAENAHVYVDSFSSNASVVSVEEAQVELAHRRSTAALVNSEGEAKLLTFNTASPFTNAAGGQKLSAAQVLRGLVKTYGGAGEIYRIVHEDLVEIVQQDGRCPCVVMFPTFTPAEIMSVSTSGDLLPAGITRHLIPGRALNVNIPLEQLYSSETLENKQSWLRMWLKQKIFDKKVRYYHEPVFIFDD